MNLEPSALALFWAAVIVVAILAYVILDGFDLGVGILFGATRDTRLRARDDRVDLSVLGRKRDLADRGGRLAFRGFPNRLRSIPRGFLHSGAAAPACAHLPRRRLRVSRSGNCRRIVGWRLRCRLDHCRLRARRRSRSHDPRNPRGERAIFRKLLRLDLAAFHHLRHWPRPRLRPDGCRLDCSQIRRSAAARLGARPHTRSLRRRSSRSLSSRPSWRSSIAPA